MPLHNSGTRGSPLQQHLLADCVTVALIQTWAPNTSNKKQFLFFFLSRWCHGFYQGWNFQAVLQAPCLCDQRRPELAGGVCDRQHFPVHRGMIIHLFLPETKGKSIMEITEEFNKLNFKNKHIPATPNHVTEDYTFCTRLWVTVRGESGFCKKVGKKRHLPFSD